jgi:hypothetical protein
LYNESNNNSTWGGGMYKPNLQENYIDSAHALWIRREKLRNGGTQLLKSYVEAAIAKPKHLI